MHRLLFPRSLPFVLAAGCIAGLIGGYGFGFHEFDSAGVWRSAAFGTGGLFLLWQAATRLLAKLSAMPAAAAASRSTWAFAAACLPAILYLPLLIVRFPRRLEPWPELLPVPEPLTNGWQMAVVLAACGLLTLTMLAWLFPALRRGPVDWLRRHPAVTLGVAMAVAATAMSYMEITRTHALRGYANIAMFTDALGNVNSADGPLYSSLFQASGASLLGVHSSFIWFLVYPLFAIRPSPDSLIVIANLVLVLAAIPAYKLSRRFFAPGVALLLALGFLFNRLLLAQAGAGEMSEERFFPLIFLSLFYFWHVRRLLPFAVLALLILTIREDMGLLLAVLGVISLVGRRSVIWWLPAILGGLAWFAIMTGLFIPSMNPGGVATRPLVIYGAFGDSTPEILINMIRRPGLVMEIVSKFMTKVTAYQIFLSAGVGLPLLSGFFFLGVPVLVESMLSQNAYPEHINMTVVAATMFPATVSGIAFINRRTSRRWNVEAAAGLALISLVSTIMLTAAWFSPDRLSPSRNHETAMKIIGQIPSDASVILPIYLAVEAQPEQRAASYYQIPYELDQQGYIDVEQDYVLLDMATMSFYERYYEGFLALKAEVESSPDFILMEQESDLFLYKRRDTAPAAASS